MNDRSISVASHMAAPRVAQAYWEREYNPRARIPDSQRYFDSWAARAASARERLGGTLDVSYGDHPRERLDVFRSTSPRGTLAFIHGGYWRAFGKEAQSWIAEAFVRDGVSVAIPSYPLAPAARLSEIVESMSRALAHLRDAVLTEKERRRVVVAGHSAGGHLAACLLASTHAEGSGPDAIVCISGVFDLQPLLHTHMLKDMGWRADELHAVSPLFMPIPSRGAVVLAVGGDESEEFHTQSSRLARAWSERMVAVVRPPGRNHYSILDGLDDTSYELRRAMLGLF